MSAQAGGPENVDENWSCVCFAYGNGIFATSNDEIISQYQLFDYLDELKIDYRGLIDKGLAIDANTLEINPYK